jgi:hypothetical protein
MAKPPPEVADLPVPQPPSRFGDPNSLQYGITDLYSALRVISVLERQARAVLIAQSQLADITALSALSLTVSVGYVQAEVQSIVTKLNEVIAKQATIIAALAELKSEAVTNIQSLAPDTEE